MLRCSAKLPCLFDGFRSYWKTDIILSEPCCSSSLNHAAHDAVAAGIRLVSLSISRIAQASRARITYAQKCYDAIIECMAELGLNLVNEPARSRCPQMQAGPWRSRGGCRTVPCRPDWRAARHSLPLSLLARTSDGAACLRPSNGSDQEMAWLSEAVNHPRIRYVSRYQTLRRGRPASMT